MGTRSLRILLVDDEPDILLLLQTLLSTSSWEIVGKAADGEAALRIAEHIKPDVAVIDYMMPGMHGLELASRLKEMYSDCEIVIFSAYALERETRDNPAVDRFLSKGDIDGLVPMLEDVAQTKLD